MDYKNKVWRAGHSWIFRARKAWWSHLQAQRRSLRACYDSTKPEGTEITGMHDRQTLFYF